MGTSCSANGQRQTITLNYEISVMWKMKPWTTPQMTSPTVNRTRTGHEA